jgi:hypothetical protein
MVANAIERALAQTWPNKEVGVAQVKLADDHIQKALDDSSFSVYAVVRSNEICASMKCHLVLDEYDRGWIHV